MKKLELRLMVVSVLLKIKFGHAHIRVPKIGKSMLETACINPCEFSDKIYQHGRSLAEYLAYLAFSCCYYIFDIMLPD